MNTDEKDKEINNLIIDLSNESAKIDFNQYLKRFSLIYEDNYRHSYAKMYGVIAQIKSEGNIDYLSENVELLNEYIVSGPGATSISDNIKARIKKFYDHVSLECAQLSYFGSIEEKYTMVERSYSNLSSDSERISKKIKLQNEDINNIQKDIDKQNKEVLSHMFAIVSIFTAVVFTALTSFNMITSIAGAVMEKDNYFWVACVLLTVAFITINLFYILLRFMGRIIGKTIFAHEKFILIVNIVLGVLIIGLFTKTIGMVQIYS